MLITAATQLRTPGQECATTQFVLPPFTPPANRPRGQSRPDLLVLRVSDIKANFHVVRKAHKRAGKEMTDGEAGKCEMRVSNSELMIRKFGGNCSNL